MGDIDNVLNQLRQLLEDRAAEKTKKTKASLYHLELSDEVEMYVYKRAREQSVPTRVILAEMVTNSFNTFNKD